MAKVLTRGKLATHVNDIEGVESLLHLIGTVAGLCTLGFKGAGSV